MIYKFNLVSDEVDNFKRVIEIDPDDTFMSLHDIILESVGYHKDQMSSFFICDNGWEKETEITEEDMGMDSDSDSYIMSETKLSELIDDEGQRLIFVFDYMTDRCFFMEMKEIITGRSVDKPVCTKKTGDAPKQDVGIDEMDSMAIASATNNPISDDFGDEFGNDGYDSEDLEGLSDDTDPFSDYR